MKSTHIVWSLPPPIWPLLCVLISLAAATPSRATPANKKALATHLDSFLPAKLNQCTTCHLPSDKKAPALLDEFPHNPFGDRLRKVAAELEAAGKRPDLASRLAVIASEDSDGDGVDNFTELLLGTGPGDAKETPKKSDLAKAARLRTDFAKAQSVYRWRPFEPVQRPAPPKMATAASTKWARNPIDTFVAAEHERLKLKPRPEAPKEVLLRRVHLDLTGLAPTPDELDAFLKDTSPDAYEKVVDRLLADARHGERWGRHWMDVWRYSDWSGWNDQYRDSTPHIWRWRDWIVESLNSDKGYDRMVIEMLAGDELAPEDENALRATGFLVRNYKRYSREKWLEDTLAHTGKAFLGLTIGCAKCHNHMTDPIAQREYYQIRAIFEPHDVRFDRLPGEPDAMKAGLARIYDAKPAAVTHLLQRGDEHRPLTNAPIAPGALALLGGTFKVEPVTLPRLATQPDKREFVLKETRAASEKAVTDAQAALTKLKPDASANDRAEAELLLDLAKLRQQSTDLVLRLESLEDDGKKTTADWTKLATEANSIQRQIAAAEARQKLLPLKKAEADTQTKHDTAAKGTDKAAQDKVSKELDAAKKKTVEAEKVLAVVMKELAAPATNTFKPRVITSHPATSTGRRLAFAKWVANRENPLAARVAMNHIWLRHFSAAIVPSVDDFGANGRAPTHPQLLDWLAAEFMARGWSMKAMHRLIVTSTTYRMASTPDVANAKIDPDNRFLWRMSSRRLEAEAVRDNLLFVSGQLDMTRGGLEIDNKLGLTSRRRSLYLRTAAEKEVEFLQIFDSANVGECYERKQTVKPQQALALANSELAINQARALAKDLAAATAPDAFIRAAYRRTLAREPRPDEISICREFLKKAEPVDTKTTPAATAIQIQRARENLALVLLNHNDFVTVR